MNERFVLIETIEDNFHSIVVNEIVRVSPFLNGKFKSKVVLRGEQEIFSTEKVEKIHDKITSLGFGSRTFINNTKP